MIVSIFQIYFFRCIKFPVIMTWWIITSCSIQISLSFSFNTFYLSNLLLHLFSFFYSICLEYLFFFYFLNFLCHFKFVSWLRAYSWFFLFFFCNPGLFYLEAHSLFCIILGLFPFILCFYWPFNYSFFHIFTIYWLNCILIFSFNISANNLKVSHTDSTLLEVVFIYLMDIFKQLIIIILG